MDTEQILWVALNNSGEDNLGAGVFVFTTEKRAEQFVSAMMGKPWKDDEDNEGWFVVRCLANGTDCGHG